MSVTQFNKNMENFFKNEPTFSNVYVKGEVSGTYESPTGHFYFTLKDQRSKVPCIVYRWFRKNIGFEIENGMKLLVRANVSIYWPHGKYQLDIRLATDEGIGKLTIAYNQLKKKLKNEGLFDDKYKKVLPEYPKKIGVITSKGGSVIHDIVKTVKKDWPYCHVLIFPAAVQGANSKSEIVAQIKNADSNDLDVLIVARGGGSLEELWSFNEESVVRAIFECRTPVISAIGHEDDTTLSDLVADKRASTPTMAASLAIKNKEDVSNHISHLNSRLIAFMSSKLYENKKEFENILKKVVFKDSSYVYNSKQDEFKLLCNRFSVVSNELIVSDTHELEKIKSSYSIRHPCKIQFDSSKSKLNELETCLIDSMNSIIKTHKVNLDKTTNNFNFQSNKLLTNKKHSLELSKSYLKTNPCQNHIDLMKNSLKLNKTKINREIYLNIEDNKKDFNYILKKPIIKNPNLIYFDKSRDFYTLKDRFVHKSNEILLKKIHDLEPIKNSPVLKNQLDDYLNHGQINSLELRLEKSFLSKINETKKDFRVILSKKIFKNPEIVYEAKFDELNKIITSNIIKNPYIMLEDYRNELKIYEEKLDKINQVIMLKKEQQKQKRIYLGIIAAIVIVVILIIIFGGIL